MSAVWEFLQDAGHVGLPVVGLALVLHGALLIAGMGLRRRGSRRAALRVIGLAVVGVVAPLVLALYGYSAGWRHALDAGCVVDASAASAFLLLRAHAEDLSNLLWLAGWSVIVPTVVGTATLVRELRRG